MLVRREELDAEVAALEAAQAALVAEMQALARRHRDAGAGDRRRAGRRGGGPGGAGADHPRGHACALRADPGRQPGRRRRPAGGHELPGLPPRPAGHRSRPHPPPAGGRAGPVRALRRDPRPLRSRQRRSADDRLRPARADGSEPGRARARPGRPGADRGGPPAGRSSSAAALAAEPVTAIRPARCCGPARPPSRSAPPAACRSTVDERLIEIDWGTWEGRPAGQPGRQPTSTGGRPTTGPRPKGRASTRCRSGSSRSAPRHLEDGLVVAVSHVSPIKAATAWALGVDGAVAWRMFLGLASITRVGQGRTSPVLLSFNETGHLHPVEERNETDDRTGTPITGQPEWQRLADHHAAVAGVHLRTLFADDPKRGETMTVEAGDLFLDYSKNRVTAETIGAAGGAGGAGRPRPAASRRCGGGSGSTPPSTARSSTSPCACPGAPGWSSTGRTSSRPSTTSSTGWRSSPSRSASGSGSAPPAGRSATSSTSGSAGRTSGRPWPTTPCGPSPTRR